MRSKQKYWNILLCVVLVSWVLYMLLDFVLENFSGDHSREIKKVIRLAGPNGDELDKVLNHYNQNKCDSFKLKAAKFLIRNMEGHFSYDTASLVSYRPILITYDSLLSDKNNKNLSYKEILTEKWNIKKLNYPLSQEVYSKPAIFDYEVLTSDFLIEHIEGAYNTWIKNPYSDSVNYNTFCKYILPYRRKNGQAIEKIRAEFYKKFFYIVKDMYPSPVIQTFDTILFKLKDFKHSGFILTDYPYLKTADFMISKRGLCENKAVLNSYIFSSLGFPVAIDYVPAWGNRNNSHAWNSLIYGGQTYAFETFWDLDRWKYKRIYNNLNIDENWGKFRLPKVFRHTYTTHNDGPFSDRRVPRSNIPAVFCNIKREDVSEEYFDAVDVNLELSTPIPPKTYYAYLCVFNNEEWKPVQWGRISGKTVIFEKMGKGIVYLPVYYKNGRVTPAGDAFILHSNGKIETLNPSYKYDKEVELVRKYPKFCLNEPYEVSCSKRWVGCKLYASNKADYTDEVMLHEIVSIPDWIPVFEQISTTKKFRYLRFEVDAEMYHKISEIQFLGQENKSLIPISVRSNGIEPTLLKNAFDSNYNTRWDKKSHGLSTNGDRRWVELDFGKAVSIGKVGISRTYDENYILPKAEYELFYWDSRWISLGRTIATSLNLLYKNVPRSSLLILQRTDTRYSKCRIFTYENKLQVWW